MAQRSSERIGRRSDDASDATRGGGREHSERGDRSGGARKRGGDWRGGATLSNDVGGGGERADELLLSQIRSRGGMRMQEERRARLGMYDTNGRPSRGDGEGIAESEV